MTSTPPMRVTSSETESEARCLARTWSASRNACLTPCGSGDRSQAPGSAQRRRDDDLHGGVGSQRGLHGLFGFARTGTVCVTARSNGTVVMVLGEHRQRAVVGPASSPATPTIVRLRPRIVAGLTGTVPRSTKAPTSTSVPPSRSRSSDGPKLAGWPVASTTTSTPRPSVDVAHELGDGRVGRRSPSACGWRRARRSIRAAGRTDRRRSPPMRP